MKTNLKIHSIEEKQEAISPTMKKLIGDFFASLKQEKQMDKLVMNYQPIIHNHKNHCKYSPTLPYL